MKVQTLGHAGMLLWDDSGAPLLLTDPWLIGSTYWRSWWLQNYPTAAELKVLSEVQYAYITHEHPDHFHPPSLRKLGKTPQFLCPDLPENRLKNYMTENGWNIDAIPVFEWRQLSPTVRVLSIPLWNDDSVLLIDTPTAFIMNINDSKPTPGNIRKLRRFADAHIPREKKRVVLSSYSPASPVNNFFRDNERVAMKNKGDYGRRINQLCLDLDADYFMPFASQVVFLRSDSRWANEFKVSYEDLQAAWTAKTELLHPYTTLDLETGEASFVAPEDYNEAWQEQLEKIAAQEHLDETVEITDEDIARLEKKMRTIRLFAMALYPRGIGFKFRDVELHWSPWSGKVTRGESGGSFTLTIPAQAIKEALQYNHFGDLGITMFTMINLNTNIRPVLVYIFFVLLTLHDYNHTTGIKEFFRWFSCVLGRQSWRIPAPG
jgi:hypothetical protein